MKTKRQILNVGAALGLLALTPTLTRAQVIYTWTGAANGTNLVTAGNWTPNGQPNGTAQDTALWDGLTTTNLVLVNGATGLPGTGFGTLGINLIMTENQKQNVTILTSAGVSAAVGINGVTNDSPNASITFGDLTDTRQLVLVGRPAAANHYFINNSTNPSSMLAPVGGGNAFTMTFGGTGDWIVNHVLRNNNSGAGAISVVLDGPGNLIWSAGGTFLASDLLGSVTVNGGNIVVKSLSLLNASGGNQQINLLGGTMVIDAPGQSDIIARPINGAGPGFFEVRNGTVTLSSGASAYNGDFKLSGGTVVVSAAETPSVSGPLGFLTTVLFNGGTLRYSTANTFDYSDRFSTDPNQAYSIDTGGQTVTLAAGLTSSGGTLTKLGAGTLNLSGTNTYTGLTTVSVGKLVIQGRKTGSGNITVGGSTVLGINVGTTPVTPATLTLGSSKLEFDNVNSTTTAPLAATTLAANGTITINVLSGSLAVGQSYPLLSWTSGAAPTVSLGILNGFLGNLTIVGNKVMLNITAAAYKWTGAGGANWDTTTANNWTLGGAPALFPNGSPVLFDDSASGTSVSLNAAVQPSTVTVYNNTKSFSISSAAGKTISGSGQLIKGGSSPLAMTGGANNYTGVTTVLGGTVSVSTLANGGAASDIGSASSSAANLVLDGGALQYLGAGASIDKLFTLGTAGGTIDNQGTGGLTLNNKGAIGYNGTGPRGLNLIAAAGITSTLAASIGDNGGATALSMNGPGTWTLTGTNPFSGVTTIASGVLQIGSGGSLGTGDVVDNGTLNFSLTNNLTVTGAISGTGNVTNDGSGTVILAANNTYTGGTRIMAGTLQIGDGGSTGQLAPGNGIINNSTLIFNSTGDFTLSGVISGTGQLIKRGSGLLKLLGNNTFTGGTTVDAGARLQIGQGNTGRFASPSITNNGTVIFVWQDVDANTFPWAGNIIGPGPVIKDSNNPNNGAVRFTGTNTYTGGTRINGGTIILGDNLTPGAGKIIGDVVMTNFSVNAGNPTASILVFNHPDDYKFIGTISGQGSIQHTGYATLTLTATNHSYTGATTIGSVDFASTLQIGDGGANGSLGTGNITDNGVLLFNTASTLTVRGGISGIGSVVKIGTGTVLLTNNTTYSGATTVSNGLLIVNGANASGGTTVNGGTLGGTGVFAGPVTLPIGGGTLSPGVGGIGTITMNSDLEASGNVAIDVDKSMTQSNDLVVVLGALYKTGNGGTIKVSNLGPTLAVGDKFTIFSQPVLSGAELTVSGGGATWVNNLAVDGSITVATVTAVVPPRLNFASSGSNLQFSWTGSFKLQAQTNSITTGISTNWVDYPGGATSPISVPIGTGPTVFFRLAP